MNYIRGRYSRFIRPILIVIDISIINLLSFYFFNLTDKTLISYSAPIFNNKQLVFSVYISVLWLLLALFIKFYNVYRFTKAVRIVSLLFFQFFVFTLITFSFVGLFRSVDIKADITLKYLATSFILIGSIKLLSYYALKKFRFYLKGNVRRVILVGNNESTNKLISFFNSNKDLGYNIVERFEVSNASKLDEALSLINSQNIDEVYCAIDDLNEIQINEFIKHTSLNKINLKFIPKNIEGVLANNFTTEYYNYIPILSFKEGALNKEINKVIKRSFDVAFSLLVIVFVLSWLVPILGLLIKLESKGPIFYKHKRNGINYKEFACYKFRSLAHKKKVDYSHVKEGDVRLTKIGKFIRRTSIDELPQFINVFFGSMSVVGPRPHMLSYTEEYSKVIDRYKFAYRHSVKPGITGLAQTKGYRGEVKNNTDIINRITLDIFYIENWTLILDIKIIFQTLINLIKGDSKAY